MKRSAMKPGKGFARKLPERIRTEVKPSTLQASACRMWDGSARMTVPIVKSAPVTHEGYRRLVAARPCIHCGIAGRSQAAHGPSLGRGIKADDRTCVALCADAPGALGCHTQADQYKLFDRHERAARFAEWAAQTQAEILAAGEWPPDLEIVCT